MTYKKMEKEFNALKNDIEKWEWVLRNQDKNIVVCCAIDYTFVRFGNEEDIILEFDNYIGWDDGLFDLLEAVGIDAEGV